MVRARKISVCLGVALLAMLTLGGRAQAVPDNTVEVIRGQGSDTTIDMMRNLADAYNETAGCAVVSTPQRLDHVCAVSGPPYNDPTDSTKWENWDHDVALNYAALGSSNGIKMLDNNGAPGNARIDFARSSRGRNPASDNPGLRFVAYAKDALAPVDFQGTVNPANCDVDRTGGPTGLFPEYDDSGPQAPATANDGTWADGPDADGCQDATVATSVKFVTHQQVKDIYLNCGGPDSPSDLDADGKMTWHDLDATKPAVPIIVWTTQLGSGTRGSWDGTFMGGDSSTCIPAAFKNASLTDGNRVIFEHDATPIVNCATDDDGTGPESIDCPDENLGDGFAVHYTQSMFYYGVGAHSVSGTNPLGQGADLLGLCTANCTTVTPTVIQPTPANIKSGAYQYSRSVFNVYRFGYTGPGANNAPDYVKDFIGEQGWICKADSFHTIDPKTSLNYGAEVDTVISASGFVPLDVQPTGVGGPDAQCVVS